MHEDKMYTFLKAIKTANDYDESCSIFSKTNSHDGKSNYLRPLTYHNED